MRTASRYQSTWLQEAVGATFALLVDSSQMSSACGLRSANRRTVGYMAGTTWFSRPSPRKSVITANRATMHQKHSGRQEPRRGHRNPGASARERVEESRLRGRAACPSFCSPMDMTRTAQRRSTTRSPRCDAARRRRRGSGREIGIKGERLLRRLAVETGGRSSSPRATRSSPTMTCSRRMSRTGTCSPTRPSIRSSTAREAHESR